MDSQASSRGIRRYLLALTLFGLAFGFIEAAVVVYLRVVYEPLHERLHPGQGGDLFPLIRLDQLEAAGPTYLRLLRVELVREAATILMLAAVALASSRNLREGLAAFVTIFGIWDLAFYAWLKVLLDWPASLLTWDLLFLLPVPWVAPVLAPVIVAITMSVCGAIAIVRERSSNPLSPGVVSWASIVAGGMILIAAFCWDYRDTMAGVTPNPFHWPLFALGEAIGLFGFMLAIRTDLGESTGSAA